MLSLLLLAPFASAAPSDDAVEAARARFAPPGEVALEAEELPWAGGTIVRFRQRLHGLPVHGPNLVASVGQDARVRRTAGRLARIAGPARPTLSAVDAVARARELGARLGEGELWAPRPELVWLDRGERLRLAWAVDLSTAAPARTWRTWIDARSGEVVQTDLTSRTARARVYPSSPLLSDPEEVVLAGLPGDAFVLSGEYTATESCDDWTLEPGWFGVTACHYVSNHATADGAGDFYFSPDPGSIDDPQAEVQVYHHIDAVAAWLDDRYGFRHAEPIRGTVNFPMANAFFGDFDGDGQGDLSFGHEEESGVDFAYDADVVYHEFGHSVVSVLADLPFLQADAWGMEWTAGGINEGYADVLAMVLTGDPLVGEYAASAFDLPAIRELSMDRRCPDDLYGEVHADGELLGSIAWNLIETVGAEATHDVFYGALPFWGRDVSWPVVGETLLDSAEDLVAAGAVDGSVADAVAAEVARANLLDCGRVMPLDDGRQVIRFMLNAGLQGDLERIPLGQQFSVEVPEDATAVEVEIVDLDAHEGMGWAVYGRSGAHVEHEVVSVDTLGLAVAKPVLYDFVVEGEGRDTVTIRADEDLVPGETLYFAVASRNLGSIDLFDFQLGTIELTARVSDAPLDPLPVVEEEAPKGCGCSAAGSAVGGAAGMGPLLFVALGLVARRRRGALSP